MNELLVLQLLLNKKEWITSNELSSTLNISVRTIRTLIKSVNIKNNLVLSSPKGYKLNIEFRDYIKTYLIDNNSNKELSTSLSRQEIIIKELLLSGNEIDFYELSEVLYVSESTLNNDLAFLRKRLEQYNISLPRKKDIILLQGKEKEIRRLMSDNIYTEIKDGLLNFNILNSVFPEYNVLSLRSTLIESMVKHDLSIDDFGITDLILHLCIMFDRIINSNSTYADINKSEIASTLYSQITIEIFRNIEKELNIEINDNEIFMIAPLIAVNTKQLLDKNTTLQDLPNFVKKDVIDFVHMLTHRIKENYSIDLGNNDFIIRFSLHLSQLLENVKRSNRNPLLNNIKNSYPLIFELSVFIADLIHKYYPNVSLDDHEISYISLHVGMSIDKDNQSKIDTILIIPDYYSLKQSIIDRISTNFPTRINIMHSYNDESEVDYSMHFDLILSTQRVSVSTNAEFLQITPFINNSDFSNIQYILEVIKFKKKILTNEALFGLFDLECFKIFDSSSYSKEYVIKYLCNMAFTAGFVSATFTNDVLKREKLSSTSYSTMAVPHSLKPVGFKTCIAVGIFRDQLQWNTNSINVVLLLVVHQNDKEKFKSLFQNVITIFTSNSWLESYKKINDFDEFIEIIKKSQV